MNNGKYDTKDYRLKQEAKNDRIFGIEKKHKKICAVCSSSYIFEGREKTKAFEQSKYCSRSCANSIGGASKIAIHYRTIAKRAHGLICIVCGFDKIVDVHHIDENRKNNDPKNLVCLCPNHHEMYHSKYKIEIEPYIKKFLGE